VITKAERFKRVFEYFAQQMPEPVTELKYTSAFELLVATILSAQCTDKRVNIITPLFFRKYHDVETLSKATEQEVFEMIRSCSYPNSKANHLVRMARMLMEEFNGQIPEEPYQLLKLPGVGRKTAHVVASVIFSKPVLAVDTHVFRVAGRIGLTTNAKTPYEAEKQLLKYIPESILHRAHHWLILHGRYICLARRPKCEQCGLTDACKYYLKLKNKN
jgi:endonuclease-3